MLTSKSPSILDVAGLLKLIAKPYVLLRLKTEGTEVKRAYEERKMDRKENPLPEVAALARSMGVNPSQLQEMFEEVMNPDRVVEEVSRDLFEQWTRQAAVALAEAWTIALYVECKHGGDAPVSLTESLIPDPWGDKENGEDLKRTLIPTCLSWEDALTVLKKFGGAYLACQQPIHLPYRMTIEPSGDAERPFRVRREASQQGIVPVYPKVTEGLDTHLWVREFLSAHFPQIDFEDDTPIDPDLAKTIRMHAVAGFQITSICDRDEIKTFGDLIRFIDRARAAKGQQK